MGMDFGSRLGIAGLIVAIAGIGITILWQKRWIGYACFFVALLLGIWWGILEYQARHFKSKDGLPEGATSTGSTGQSGATASTGKTIPQPPQLTRSQDKMTWDYDSYKQEVYFLSLCKCGGITTLNAFQAVGDNETDDPIHITKMYLRSDINNATLPVLISVANYSGGVPAGIESLDPQDTSGVPPHTHFRVTSANIQTLYPGEPIQVPVELFLKDFLAFTFVVDYEGGHYERHFHAEEVKRQVAQFEAKAIDEMTRTAVPRVTKKAN
jgi:hypothetical protein